MAVSHSPERPLRRDAERNRQLILAAARELFTERGLGVGLDEIARHAGLGVGTVYRRFPDKDQLIDALFEARVDEIRAVAEAALVAEDPWQGFVDLLTGSISLQVEDRGLKELLVRSDAGLERVCVARERIAPLAEAVLERAHAAGILRAEVTAQDIPFLHMMIGAVVDAARDEGPELWRRYLAALLAGLRADAGDPLPVPALGEEAMRTVIGRTHRGR